MPVTLPSTGKESLLNFNQMNIDNLITNLEFRIAFAETNLRYIASEPLYEPRREELREFNLKVIEDTKRELAEALKKQRGQ